MYLSLYLNSYIYLLFDRVYLIMKVVEIYIIDVFNQLFKFNEL